MAGEEEVKMPSEKLCQFSVISLQNVFLLVVQDHETCNVWFPSQFLVKISKSVV